MRPPGGGIGQSYNENPVWTPDGRRVTFGSTEGPGGIYWAPE